jgi:hypothetical protein
MTPVARSFRKTGESGCDAPFAFCARAELQMTASVMTRHEKTRLVSERGHGRNRPSDAGWAGPKRIDLPIAAAPA